MDNGHPAAGRPASPAASLIRKAFAAFVLLAAVVGAFLYWRAADHAPHAVQGQAPRGPAPVHVLRLAAQTIPIEPVYLGQTEAAQTVEIRARVNGFLDRRTFTEGSIVSPGQQLFQIDPRSFKADLDIAKAGLANYEAVLTRAHHQVKRYEKLATTGAATANDLEEWQTEELVAQSNIELQKAKIAQAELDLSYTNIASPITGRIGEAQKDVGSYVNASSDGLLAEVEQIDPIYVRFTVSEQDLLRWQRQIESGAPVDVFASADQKTMDQAAAKSLIVAGTRADFVQNGLVLIQPADAKLALKTLSDLTQPGVKRIAIGNPETVPAGRYAKEALTSAKLWDTLSPKLVPGESVRQTLDYVVRGEADAGFVFATDARIVGGKVRVACEAPSTTPVRYPIAVVAASRNPKAKAFVDFVLSPAGQKILQDYGFKKP